ncbi:MAG: ACT domain-containing protein [Micrococcales bacterium]|uniref:ACT domain-containing protein n=1 Tax=Phycicoccus sp. TaxID=1902410 RepID=UPI0019A0DDF9|nr:ACT domain-containing protein [Phycicoccus sp.]MBD3782902.1 ACT domain-containing protein [Micrococcales bacterium]HMM95902.1 ACT domain-containing protein [Phycicoccus sp.]
MPLHLMEHPEDVSVVRLPSGEEPAFDWTTGPLASLTRTAEETSVICATASVPRGARTEGPFRAVEVAGPLDFSAVGVFAEILAPLVDAGISVLGLSTFDTDWVLVPAERTADASQAWRRAGFVITPTSLSGGR